MRSIVFLAICLVAAQAAALDKAVVEEEVSRAPAPFKALAVNNAVGGNLPGLSAAACPLVMKTNTQITPFPIRSDAVCDSFGLGQANNLYACAAFGQMGSILGKPDLRCAPDAIPLHPDTDTAGKADPSTKGIGAWGHLTCEEGEPEGQPPTKTPTCTLLMHRDGIAAVTAYMCHPTDVRSFSLAGCALRAAYPLSACLCALASFPSLTRFFSRLQVSPSPSLCRTGARVVFCLSSFPTRCCRLRVPPTHGCTATFRASTCTPHALSRATTHPGRCLRAGTCKSEYDGAMQCSSCNQ